MKKSLFFISLALAGAMISPALAQEPFSHEPFTDLKQSHPHYEAIEFLRENNIIKGYPDGTFKPDRRISRSEFVKLVINPFILDTERINECLRTIPDTESTVYFPDVPKTAWFAVEVCFAKTKRIIDGYPDGKFRPGGYISFVETAKILSNVFSFEIATEEQGEFWYRPYAQRLAELHAIPTSVLRFDQMLTRGEMAEMLFRLKTQNDDRASQSYEKMR